MYSVKSFKGASKSGAICTTVPRRVPGCRDAPSGLGEEATIRATAQLCSTITTSSPGANPWTRSDKLACASRSDTIVMCSIPPRQTGRTNAFTPMPRRLHYTTQTRSGHAKPPASRYAGSPAFPGKRASQPIPPAALAAAPRAAVANGLPGITPMRSVTTGSQAFPVLPMGAT